ncbi:MAG TPA: hypothetical protein DHU55_11650 [Blastocatellia bacterium]|nr:hypothetical protein [Blastocatellia bacterium]HAF25544.1 hypothetical protein [Blastocatellia bacterium]HCX30401.1 hypothetical protein [Blastocatellia bacterium]
MIRYVAFLRAINVGGRNRIRMEGLRVVCLINSMIRGKSISHQTD